MLIWFSKNLYRSHEFYFSLNIVTTFQIFRIYMYLHINLGRWKKLFIKQIQEDTLIMDG